jgi:hypothetical protein
VAAAAGLFRRAGYEPVLQVLAGPSPFRLLWRGDTAGLGAAVAAQRRNVPAAGPRLFVEGELAALWREFDPSAEILELEECLLAGGAGVPLTGAPFTALPPPLPLAAADWTRWLARWRALAPQAWRPPPAESRGLRAEALASLEPTLARRMARRWLEQAGTAGVETVAVGSPRTLGWLRAAGAARPSLLPLAPFAVRRLA